MDVAGAHVAYVPNVTTAAGIANTEMHVPTINTSSVTTAVRIANTEIDVPTISLILEM